MFGLSLRRGSRDHGCSSLWSVTGLDTNKVRDTGLLSPTLFFVETIIDSTFIIIVNRHTPLKVTFENLVKKGERIDNKGKIKVISSSVWCLTNTERVPVPRLVFSSKIFDSSYSPLHFRSTEGSDLTRPKY